MNLGLKSNLEGHRVVYKGHHVEYKGHDVEYRTWMRILPVLLAMNVIAGELDFSSKLILSWLPG